MKEADHLPPDHRLARLHIVILLAAWLVGTALVLAANAAAPTTPTSRSPHSISRHCAEAGLGPQRVTRCSSCPTPPSP
ncbi:MAG: hypothetical protein Q8K93_07995 [Reyranella sp.]|uniref:hypothetical protein n=1 Tax=Reyranella sp. TaxID=1929291 RepID=UPI00272F6921|nr:hypothetical protein [Reyranella sp.]MDP1962126.1 hypothetical protein [Reyranella sp.]MDP2374779.1 hypothetical protein [Reyranella sp.]